LSASDVRVARHEHHGRQRSGGRVGRTIEVERKRRSPASRKVHVAAHAHGLHARKPQHDFLQRHRMPRHRGCSPDRSVGQPCARLVERCSRSRSGLSRTIPRMMKEKRRADEKPALWLPYTQMKTASPPLAAARTEGCRIILADGRVLVDGTSSWWTACHGYNHPHIRRAVAAQLERMPHVMLGGLVHEQAATLAERLAAVAPGDLAHVFFSESGSVSVEIAMKIAIQYWLNRGRRRTRF